MGIPPSTQQQHGLLQPAGLDGMDRPVITIPRVALEPCPCHALRIMLLQQVGTFPEISAVFKAATNVVPGLIITTSFGLKGG